MCMYFVTVVEGEWNKKLSKNEAPKKSFDFDSRFCVFVRFHWQISKDTVPFFVLRRLYAMLKVDAIQRGTNICLHLKKWPADGFGQCVIFRPTLFKFR